MTYEEIKAAYKKAEPFIFADPAYAHLPLPHSATFYPLGFPVEITTNCPEVLEAAAESWLGYVNLFRTDPIHIRVAVIGSSFKECPPVPTYRIQCNLLTAVADQETFSVSDLAQRFCYISASRTAINHRSYFRYFLLEAAALGQISSCYATAIHGASVEWNGKGVLLCGDSGAGKSTLSYACAQAGWTYITDDASYLVNGRKDRLVVGTYKQLRFRPSAVQLFPEFAGREVTQRAELGKPSIEVLTSPLKHLKRAPTAHIDHIVFLARDKVKRQEVVPLPRAVARHFMLQIRAGTADSRVAQENEINHLLRIQPLELRYRDLKWAINRLTELATEGS